MSGTGWRLLRNLRASLGPAPLPPAPDGVAAELAAQLDGASRRRLGRSLALWHLPTGGCNACELELAALGTAAYELGRLGLRFVGSPRHADVLLVTGPVTRALHGAVLAAWEAVPDPKWVVAIGACPLDGGPFRGSYAVHGGLDGVLPVDLAVQGCPPEPAAILSGLRALVEANA